MKITDVMDSVEKTLKEKFKNRINKVIFNDVEQGLEPPAFFVQVLPISENPLNRYQYEQSLLIAITYIQKKQSKYELAKIVDELRKIFSINIKINDRSLLIKDKESRILTNDRLNFTFSIDLLENLALEDVPGYYQSELMKELYIEGEGELNEFS